MPARASQQIPLVFDELPDPRARANAPATSRKAARHMIARASTLRYLTLQAIAEAPAGLTADQAAAAIGSTPFATRPRCSELLEAGWIRDSAQRRDNESRHSAVVWVVTAEGRKALEPDPEAP